MARKKSQPWGIVLTTLLLAIAGLVMVVAGGASYNAVPASSTTPATITDPTGLLAYMPVPSVLAGISIALIIVGLLFFAFAYLMWQHNELGWYGTATFVGIGLFLNVVWALFFGLAVATPMLVGIVLCAVILLALFHKSTIKAINPDIDYNGWKLPS
jgi:hypothetical protein